LRRCWSGQKNWRRKLALAARRLATAELPSDSQALAALGAACVDDGTAATGLHTDQKAVGTGAADFGSLVSAFHDEISC